MAGNARATLSIFTQVASICVFRTNEQAQSHGAGQEFARYWTHNARG